MFNIIDYAKYYKDTSLDEVKWNILDNLICAILVYLPINTFNDTKNIKELNIKSDIKSRSIIRPKAIEILDIIKDSKRYENMCITNFTNIRSNEVQFGACTFKINNEKIISFKGTDSSMIGWLENFRLSYEYPTYTQNLAINYLKENITSSDKSVYVVGHSKGGNLAMASTMEQDTSRFNKIKRVYNFDGPGFKLDEYESDKYKKLKEKLTNILPTDSIVGTLLFNDDYNVIVSNKKGVYEHYPTSWSVFGQYFINGKLSSFSNTFHKKSISELKNIDKDELKEVIETSFKSFEKNYSSDLKFNFNDFRNFYKNMKNVDPKIKKYIDDILTSLSRSIENNN